MVRHAMSRTETSMPKHEANQQRSLAAFLAKKAEGGEITAPALKR